MVIFPLAKFMNLSSSSPQSIELFLGNLSPQCKRMKGAIRLSTWWIISMKSRGQLSSSSIDLSVCLTDNLKYFCSFFELTTPDVLKRLKIAPRSPKAKSVPLPRPRSLSRDLFPLAYVSPVIDILHQLGSNMSPLLRIIKPHRMRL